jgi:hypothetical protein
MEPPIKAKCNNQPVDLRNNQPAACPAVDYHYKLSSWFSSTRFKASTASLPSHVTTWQLIKTKTGVESKDQQSA